MELQVDQSLQAEGQIRQKFLAIDNVSCINLIFLQFLADPKVEIIAVGKDFLLNLLNSVQKFVGAKVLRVQKKTADFLLQECVESLKSISTMQGILLALIVDFTFNILFQLIEMHVYQCNAIISCLSEHHSYIISLFFYLLTDSSLYKNSHTNHSLPCSIFATCSLIFSLYLVKVFLTFSYDGGLPLFKCCCVCSQMQVAHSPTRHWAE